MLWSGETSVTGPGSIVPTSRTSPAASDAIRLVPVPRTASPARYAASPRTSRKSPPAIPATATAMTSAGPRSPGAGSDCGDEDDGAERDDGDRPDDRPVDVECAAQEEERPEAHEEEAGDDRGDRVPMPLPSARGPLGMPGRAVRVALATPARGIPAAGHPGRDPAGDGAGGGRHRLGRCRVRRCGRGSGVRG